MIRKVAVKDKNRVIRTDDVGVLAKNVVFPQEDQPEENWSALPNIIEYLSYMLDRYGERTGALELRAEDLTESVKAAERAGVPIVTTEGTGEAYTATIPGVTELRPGMLLVIIPHISSSGSALTLNVNGLGEKSLIYSLGRDMSAFSQYSGPLTAGMPYILKYQNNPPGWVLTEKTVYKAKDLTGELSSAQLPVVPVSKGGTGLSNLVGTDYSAYRVRSAAILSSVPTSMDNGTLAFVYI